MQRERGMALGLALLVIVLVGVLVVGALFSGTQEQRLADNSRRLEASFGVAEAGSVEQLRTWTPATRNSKGFYPSDSGTVNATTTPGGTGFYSGTVYKMNGNIYLVSITGSDKNSAAASGAGGGARQQLGLLTKILPITFTAKGALITGGSAKIQQNVTINGNDQAPAGWSGCPPPDSAVPGVHADSGETIVVNSPARILGNPSVVTDNLVQDSTFTKFGPYTDSSLAAMAAVTLPAGSYGPQPAVTSGSCDHRVLTNWGDGLNPAGPCGAYFPLVHVTGDLKINTGSGVQGQGILVVDGKFEVRGPFSYFGIVIASNGTKFSGNNQGDPKFLGTILSGSKSSITTKSDTLLGTTNAQVGYSSCAILKAMQGAAITTPLRSRGWSQLFTLPQP
ncbi:MAG TPA: hypothetical protein VM716_07235 [Gemmatimonadales bacterium]|nr:hypothetical protein [Gemmatimonadales bacterium]